MQSYFSHVHCNTMIVLCKVLPVLLWTLRHIETCVAMLPRRRATNKKLLFAHHIMLVLNRTHLVAGHCDDYAAAKRVIFLEGD